MSDSRPVAELRHSVSVLAGEWWVLVGALGGYLLLGGWVAATGIAFTNAVPSAGTAPVTTLGGTAVTGREIFAAVVWILAPALAAAWLLDHRLSNDYGNLASQYRIDNPGALPAPSGVLMVLATLVALVVGPRWPVVAVLAIASGHFFVRTVAYGRRVYSVSWRPLFWALSTVGGAALAAAWVVHVPALPAPVGEWLALAGAGAVAETGLAVAGTTAATAAGTLVTVPAALAGGYLAIQSAVARRVRAKAPLSAPDKRAEQRFPIMPPVSQGARSNGSSATSEDDTPSFAGAAAASEDNSASADSSATDSEPTPVTDGSAADIGDDTDDNSQTQVFTAEEGVPEGEAVTAVADDDEDDDDDDEWIDDTSIFSPDDGGTDGDECSVCGDPIPEDTSVTFCPNCGQQIRD